MRLLKIAVLTVLALVWISFAAREPQVDPRLKGSFRKPVQQDGWTVVHLEGTPAEIGFQHGWLLGAEIVDSLNVQKVEFEHDSSKKWDFYRDAAEHVLWPHIEKEYREELQGIADGLKARNIKLDLWDIVALNAAMEWEYYTKQYDKQHGVNSPKTMVAPEHCSAFVATGSYTKDGKPVIGHNNWTSYMEGTRWTIAFDIKPVKGHRFVMDGYPGLIHSADDFGVNDAGIVITETTISNFEGFDPNGVAEFVRARKAMQYSENIDDFARIMKDGNNGGYANDWLVADMRHNEIASLELGLKNVELKRTKDGYFTGANYPINEKLLKEETNYNPNDPSVSGNARRARWEELMKENKGKIDLAAGKKFLGVKRLRQIIVGPRIDALHPLHPAAARGEDQDGGEHAGLAQALQHRYAVQPWQAEIEDDQAEILRLGAEQPILAIGGTLHDIAGPLQYLRQIGCDLRLVFHHQHTHQRHRMASSRLRLASTVTSQ